MSRSIYLHVLFMMWHTLGRRLTPGLHPSGRQCGNTRQCGILKRHTAGVYTALKLSARGRRLFGDGDEYVTSHETGDARTQGAALEE